MPSLNTPRQQDHRERSRRQLRFVQTEVRVYGVGYLTRRGLLATEVQGDRVAVRNALNMFLDTTLHGGA